LNVKLLLKRGAMLAAANWPTVAIQFVAETTFQVLLAVPILGASMLVAVLLGADIADLLQGGLRQTFTAIANALTSQPIALAAFVTAFTLVLFGGSVLMFLVKGGIVDVLAAANTTAPAIERRPITLETLRTASCFTLDRFTTGCGRLFRPYLALGMLLISVYAVSVGGYLVVVVYGFRAEGDRVWIIGWTVVAAILLVAWITVVNLLYLLLQIAIAVEGLGIGEASGTVLRFIRAEFRNLAGVFIVELAIVIGATLVSALAWSGVGLIAFVPLVGLAVFPLQMIALILRGLVFEYIGLAALGAYVTLYCGFASRREELRFNGRRSAETARLKPRAT
jgi:hypothetical protein